MRITDWQITEARCRSEEQEGGGKEGARTCIFSGYLDKGEVKEYIRIHQG